MSSASVPFSPSVANEFAIKWKTYTEEEQWERTFWHEFLRDICGIEDYSLAGIEPQKRVLNPETGNQERIDLFWRDVAIIEHKSASKSLVDAESQARRYLKNLPPPLRPPYLILCNFQEMSIIDAANSKRHDFPLIDLPKYVHLIEQMASRTLFHQNREELIVDQQAAKLMADIYVNLADSGIDEHLTSIFLVRLLFLLFGDDTGMWKRNSFKSILQNEAISDSVLPNVLQELFSFLNTKDSKRSATDSKRFSQMPYINGGIFSEEVTLPRINARLRKSLINAANYDWGAINPTIFGALFQLIKSKEDRSALGEHYTSEENILKVIKPLFLDNLYNQLVEAWDDLKALRGLRKNLGEIKVFDPACGCGNFLVVAYKYLRQLEREIIVRSQELSGKTTALALDGTFGLSVGLHQLFGIEILEWPSQVARVATYLTDHQENLKLEKVTGIAPNRFPIRETATIINENSLKVDWQDVLTIDSNCYILGNPPFVGMYLMSKEQQIDRDSIFEEFDQESSRTGRLDYVASWYAKAISSIRNSGARCAFVSTNSLCQGEQARTMGPFFANTGFEIDFAFPTFPWSSDLSNAAAVHVVIIGFSKVDKHKNKVLYFYDENSGRTTKKTASHINFYLIDGPDIELVKRETPLVLGLPDCTKGSQPTDGGYLLIKEAESVEALKDPIAKKYLRRFIGATELLYDETRYCLWLVDASPKELRESNFIKKRLDLVAKIRLQSPTKSVRDQAAEPHLFTQIRQPRERYLALPKVSSENRACIPAAYFEPSDIAGDGVLTIPGAPLWVFGYLQSRAFTDWVATFSGRLESRFRINPAIVYFTFPFKVPKGKDLENLVSLSQNVLTARGECTGLNLAEMYEPLQMPKVLRDSHKALDKFVDHLYFGNRDISDSMRLEILINAYNEIMAGERLSN